MDKIPTKLITVPTSWKSYELIDCGDSEKLERFGNVVLIRPEPSATWPKKLADAEWQKLHDIKYNAQSPTTGEWIKKNKDTPNEWLIDFKSGGHTIKLKLALTAFKHIGIFPEQAANWEYIASAVKSFKTPSPKVLNLFAYTGGATLMAQAAGAQTTHVDSIKQVVSWANKNQELSGLKDIRWIVEDALKFVKREIKRGNTYHGIVLDPPAYGHGPKGEKWKLETQIEELIKDVVKLLDKNEHFLIINTYTTGFFPDNIEFLFRKAYPEIENLEVGQLYLQATSGTKLPLSAYGRFNKNYIASVNK